MTPLPPGPTLALPAGELGVLDGGRLFYHGPWVIAVGIAPDVFVVVRERSDRFVPGRLLHSLLGYLTACGCNLIPADIRCPVSWRMGSSAESIRGQWTLHVLREGNQLMFNAKLIACNTPPILLPLATVAEDGETYWRSAGLVADAMQSDAHATESMIRPLLWQMSAAWERHWHKALSLEAADGFSSESEAAVRRCDEAWASVVRAHLAPHGYQVQPASLARLL